MIKHLHIYFNVYQYNGETPVFHVFPSFSAAFRKQPGVLNPRSMRDECKKEMRCNKFHLEIRLTYCEPPTPYRQPFDVFDVFPSR